MGQEISVSYQAVKSKVYKLIDAMVEGSKSPAEVQESMRRWWGMIHPADRAVAQKYMLAVLQKSNASLTAMSESLLALKEFEAVLGSYAGKEAKLPPGNGHAQVSRPI